MRGKRRNWFDSFLGSSPWLVEVWFNNRFRLFLFLLFFLSMHNETGFELNLTRSRLIRTHCKVNVSCHGDGKHQPNEVGRTFQCAHLLMEGSVLLPLLAVFALTATCSLLCRLIFFWRIIKKREREKNSQSSKGNEGKAAAAGSGNGSWQSSCLYFVCCAE